MCFIGHGMFGFITKKIWCNYFGVFGIGEGLAYQLMPVVGAMDVGLGLLLLVYPMRFAAVWLVFWGVFTASLRPLSGEPFAELIERAGNFGAPLVLLLLSLPAVSAKFGLKDRLVPDLSLSERRLNTLRWSLRVFGFLLLLGHGWLNLLLKPGLITQYAKLGFADPEGVAFYLGVFECMAACVVLLKPIRSVVLFIFIWKVVSEVPYPTYAIFEWVERGGSYAVLLGLWMILKDSSSLGSSFYKQHYYNIKLSGKPVP